MPADSYPAMRVKHQSRDREIMDADRKDKNKGKRTAKPFPCPKYTALTKFCHAIVEFHLLTVRVPP